MFIVLGTGTQDMCWNANEKMAAIFAPRESIIGWMCGKMLHTIGLPGEKCFRTIFRSSNNFK